MSSPTNWIGQVAALALERFDSTAALLGISGGKRHGPEYQTTNPTRTDNKAGSFSINTTNGAWSDFATGDKGGDLVSLARYLWGMPSQSGAADRLGDLLGLTPPPRKGKTANPAATGPKTPPASPQATEKGGRSGVDTGGFVCVMPAPDDAPPPPAAHARHGKPSRRYEYRDAAGRLCFIHDRFEPKRQGERKQFAPLSLWRAPDGVLVWHYKAPAAPRPLLGLPDLAARPDARVIVTEGEKACEAAQRLAPQCVCVTWAGGAQAVDKADWQPLAGRDVWLWPDADEPGTKAMQTVATALGVVGVASVACFNLVAMALKATGNGDAAALEPGEALPAGDDAADFEDRGWTPAHFALWLVRPDAFPVPTPQATAQRGGAGAIHPSGAAEVPPAAAVSEPASGERFRLDGKGVWLIERDREGNERRPRWLCDPLRPVARVRDPENRGWGLLVEFRDPDGRMHREIVPMEHFRGDGLEVAALLLANGLQMAPKVRAFVVEYLQCARPEARARTTNRVGWHSTDDGLAFVLPDGALGECSEEWLFMADGAPVSAFRTRGSLSGWRDEVARLCAGNSRLVFAVSLAFASPLLYLVEGESGGFHFRSNSSDGKTTALRVAASVCGSPDYMQRWRATDNGLESLALQHCDAPLLLDELAQVDGRVAGESAYMLANGAGKVRSIRTGGARDLARWRLLFLSAGEIGLTQHMAEVGKVTRAGQEIRLAEIPADAGAGMGAFENLHGYAGGADFAKALDGAARKQYGHPFRAFVSKLIDHRDDVAGTARGFVKKFEAAHLTANASGQARRVAHRFALVAAAGELATDWGITGWEPGEALGASGRTFAAWLAQRGGEGHQESRAMLEAVRKFLHQHGEARFSDWDRPLAKDDHAPRVINKAGVKRFIPDPAATTSEDTPGAWEHFIYPEVFREEVCKGYDYRAVVHNLVKLGAMLGPDKDGKLARKVRLPGEGDKRVFRILPTIWEADYA
ncbi:DUF927 domain-containing protein [Niveibacterium sp. 24ML]|uniref:DUF927 domain-containing protein n=1 Tax=Niveibacterium sp. 24ML TaxID=2985512 RepID=UPI00226E9AA5|nr:DUF927 domain-containing protein [Niveibacterium sp. 24ML]MCX9155874.1 DUF927 domain-containing protein [Niveibacterium sp. 24ML]